MDQLDKAIAGADGHEETVQLRQVKIRMSSTGRPAIVAFPIDATDSELADMAGFLLVQAMGILRTERQRQAPAARLVVPRGMRVKEPARA